MCRDIKNNFCSFDIFDKVEKEGEREGEIEKKTEGGIGRGGRSDGKLKM